MISGLVFLDLILDIILERCSTEILSGIQSQQYGRELIMSAKYVFFDFETTGKGKVDPNSKRFGSKWEQILQVGAILVDENLQQTNYTLNEYCRLRTSIIPQPGALLTTKRDIKQALQADHSSYQLINRINEQFNEWKKESPGTVFIGHNSINFDETLLEYNLFNNLLYPYITRPNRGDTINLARGLYAANPSAISTLPNEKGNPSFALPNLAEANNFPVELAHDALSDVRTTISLAKHIHDSDPEIWKQLQLTMNAKETIEYINKNKAFSNVNFYFGKPFVHALSLVCEDADWNGYFHTIDLKFDPDPLLTASAEEFKKLIDKKKRWVIANKNPLIFPAKLAKNYPPYNGISSDELNARAKKIFKNKSLAEKIKLMHIDKKLEELDSKDEAFPETAANKYFEFPKSDIGIYNQFHQQPSWKEKYKIALKLQDPRTSFIAKRLIFDESPETLTEDDFRKMHRELHDRLVINEDRPFTTIPESMAYVDTELAKIEERGEDNSEDRIKILNDFNQYLIFMEKYFSNKNARPLKQGNELVKQIFG